MLRVVVADEGELIEGDTYIEERLRSEEEVAFDGLQRF